MKMLEDRIRECGKVYPGNVLKVDSFLNHQIDCALISAMGDEFYRLFNGSGVTKILTIESSGIAIASITALKFGVPMLFAKKNKSKNLSANVYSASVKSYTRGGVNEVFVSKDYLEPGDKVLVIDDFLANGDTMLGLIDIIEQAGAVMVGAGIAVEKCFQGGGELLRARGIRIESLARIASLSDNTVTFAE